MKTEEYKKITEIDFKKFRENLSKVRGALGMSAKTLSEKAALKQKKRINDIEEGRGVPSIFEIHNICYVLGHAIDDMLYKDVKITITFELDLPY